MKIKSVVIEDFRSFRGKSVINFAPKGVTVFCGENGGGKTNFLNAIYWCITGKTTPRCSKPGQLSYRENGVAMGRAKVTIVLDVSEDVGHALEYHITRQVKDYAQARVFDENTVPASSVKISEVEDGGYQREYKTDEDVNRVLNRYWPSQLASWFFFDSEAIGSLKLSGQGSDNRFKENVRSALGLDAYYLLERDLKYLDDQVSAEVTTSLKASKKNLEELEKVSRTLAAVRRKIDANKQLIAQLTLDVKGFDKDIGALQDQLVELPTSHQTQVTINTSVAAKDRAETTLKDEQRALSGLVGQMGLCLTEDMYSEFLAYIQNEKKAERIPSSIQQQLIKDILVQGICICGNTIDKESPEYKRLEKLLLTATTNDMVDRVSLIQTLLEAMNDKLIHIWNNIEAKKASISSLMGDIAGLEIQLEGLQHSLDTSNDEKVAEIKEQIKTLTKLRDEANKTKNDAQDELERLVREVRPKCEELELNLQKRIGGDSRLLRLRQNIADLKRLATERMLALEANLLDTLSTKMNEMIKAKMRKHRRVSIDRDTYSVSYAYDFKGVNPDSTGEEQMLKFAFLTAMMSLSKEKLNSLYDHAIASRPLFVDAPFSTLDSIYRKNVALELAESCEQLVLMTASDGWNEDIQNVMKPHVGKLYLIQFEEHGPRDGKDINPITINGQVYEMNSYGASHSQSTFKEIQL